MQRLFSWKDCVVDGVHSLVQPDRYTLSARGRGLTHLVDPGLVPWPPPVSVLGPLPATTTPAPGPGLAGAAWLAATRWADLGDNLLGEAGLTQALAAMPQLVQLDASRNTVETLPMTCLQLCPGLQRVDLSRNYLRAFPLLSGRPMHHLHFLDMSCNQLTSLCGVEEMTALRELYLANNHILALQDLQPLRKLQRLCVLDLTGNAVSEDANFKKFVVFHLRSLEVRGRTWSGSGLSFLRRMDTRFTCALHSVLTARRWSTVTWWQPERRSAAAWTATRC